MQPFIIISSSSRSTVTSLDRESLEILFPFPLRFERLFIYARIVAMVILRNKFLKTNFYGIIFF